MTDFRALCAELVDDLELCDWPYKLKETIRADIDRARAALAEEPAVPTVMEIVELTDEIEAAGLGQVDLVRAALARWGTSNLAETRSSLGGMPTPVPADKGEVEELVAWLRDQDGWMGARVIYSRIAELLQRLSPPQPVPVSERLPGQEDCDAEGRYWGLINGCEAWVLGKGSPSTLNITHWLPAHALPVPGQEVR